MDLSIIILTFNTKDITDRCLGSLKVSVDYCEENLKNSIEVIVLDNASSDGSVEMIQKKHPWVKLIESSTNTGFSKGNNIALKKTSTPYILLLNSDVYVKKETITNALEYLNNKPDVDVLGCRLTFEDGSLQPSAGELPNFFNIPLWILGLGGSFHPKDKTYFSISHKVGWIMGAFFMFKKEVLEKTDGFDENLFMHMEEIEWCKRIKDRGFKVWYVPQVEVVHLHGASSNFDLGASFLNEIKGIRYYLKKHFSSSYFWVKLFLILGLVLRVMAFSLLGKTKRARIYLEGLSYV